MASLADVQQILAEQAEEEEEERQMGKEAHQQKEPNQQQQQSSSANNNNNNNNNRAAALRGRIPMGPFDQVKMKESKGIGQGTPLDGMSNTDDLH
jgi:hypothetical protein